MDWIQPTGGNGNPPTAVDIPRHCNAQYVPVIVREWMNLFISRTCDQILATDSALHDDPALQVSRISRDDTVREMMESVSGCVRRWVFNLDMLGSYFCMWCSVHWMQCTYSRLSIAPRPGLSRNWGGGINHHSTPFFGATGFVSRVDHLGSVMGICRTICMHCMRESACFQELWSLYVRAEQLPHRPRPTQFD
jgi:hypothetical protein